MLASVELSSPGFDPPEGKTIHRVSVVIGRTECALILFVYFTLGDWIRHQSASACRPQHRYFGIDSVVFKEVSRSIRTTNQDKRSRRITGPFCYLAVHPLCSGSMAFSYSSVDRSPVDLFPTTDRLHARCIQAFCCCFIGNAYSFSSDEMIQVLFLARLSSLDEPSYFVAG